MRAINIVTSDDDDRELKTLLVRMDKHFRSRLAGSVWISRSKNAGLEQIIRVIPNFSVNLVGRNVNELLDSNFLGTLQQHMGSIYIGVGEGVRVSEAQIDVGLSGEVEDGIDLVSLQAVHNLGGVSNVAMVE